VSVAATAFARVSVQLALGWLAFQVTGSAFLVGAISAVRMAPQIPLGIPAGMVADWLDRRTLVVCISIGSAAIALGVAGLAAMGLLSVPVILGAALAFGLLDTLRTTATQAYAYDLVQSSQVARGLAVVNLGSQLLGTVGGLVAGFTLQEYGGGATFLVVGAVLALGGLAPAVAAPPARAPASTTDAEPAPARAPFRRQRPSMRAAFMLVVRNRLVAMLAVTIIVTEVLGFSSQTILPTFARDVFMRGAAGLGVMTAARSIGGAVSLVLLSQIGTRERSGMALLGASGVIGLSLVAFALSPGFEVALVWLVLVGAASALSDTLGQVLVQQSVGDRERGAAMGLWVFSIGFAPAGHLTLGAMADAIGAPITLAIFGSLLACGAAALTLYAPLRRVK
jgi:MFS family permease